MTKMTDETEEREVEKMSTLRPAPIEMRKDEFDGEW